MSVVSGASGSASYYTGADGATSAYGDATLAGGASVSGYTRASNAAAAAYQEEVTGWAAVRQKLGQLKKKWKSKGEPQKKCASPPRPVLGACASLQTSMTAQSLSVACSSRRPLALCQRGIDRPAQRRQLIERVCQH